MRVNRRELLILSAAAIGASQGLTFGVDAQSLEQFATGGPPCAVDVVPTPSAGKDPAFRPGSPRRRSLVDTATGSTSGNPLNFSGTVSGVRCGRVNGARVDVWHADPRGMFDLQGFAFRGYQLTNAQGEFTFETVMPGAAAGRAPYFGVNVKLTGKIDFWTVLFFPDDSRNKTDRRFRQELVLKVVPDGRRRRAHFDVLLDL